MTTAQHHARLPSQNNDEPIRQSTGLLPPFKPVALPALTAAVRAAYREPARKQAIDFPTLLRISAMVD